MLHDLILGGEWILVIAVVAAAVPELAAAWQFILAACHYFRNHYGSCRPVFPRTAVLIPAWNEGAVIGESIDRLTKADALAALTDPASRRDIAWEQTALDYVFDQTGGYPYFLQQYGKYIWDVASDTTITLADARTGGREAQERLDDGFFQVRFERATAAERTFLTAMTHCEGPPYSIAEVTSQLGKSDQRSISVQRNALIKKGLIYAPRHGTLDYTVPGFGEYLNRRDEHT